MDAENTRVPLNAKRRQSKTNPEKLAFVDRAQPEHYTNRNKAAMRLEKKTFSSRGIAERKTVLVLFKGQVVTSADKGIAPRQLFRLRGKFDTSVS